MTFNKDSKQESDMERNNEQDNFSEKVRKVLDDSADDIDELTLSRIRAARANAVSTADKKHAPGRGWIPVGSFATVLFVVLAAFLFNQNKGDLPLSIEADDMEMLSSVDSLEILDDLEFYLWLDVNMELGEEADIEAMMEPYAPSPGFGRGLG